MILKKEELLFRSDRVSMQIRIPSNNVKYRMEIKNLENQKNYLEISLHFENMYIEANNKQVFIKYILIEAVRNWAPFNFGEIKTAELLEIVLF